MNSLREVVFGLEDGIVSTLGSLTGIAAATQDSYIIILAGFVIVFVESLSMAAGTYLSNKTDKEKEERLLKEQRNEILNHPEKERAKLGEYYKSKGFTDQEVQILLRRITQDKELWLEEMAHKKLGVAVDEDGAPLLDALFMGVSYIIGGFSALTPYFFLEPVIAIPASIGVSFVALFAVGWVKGHLVHVNKLKSGLEMLVISVSAAGLGYAVGQIIEYFFGV